MRGTNTRPATRIDSRHPSSYNPTMDEDLQFELTLAAPMQAVYIALTSAKGLRAWWTEHAEVATSEGGISRFDFPGAGFETRMEMLELSPFSRVHWRCVSCQHPASSGWTDREDWTGTEPLWVIRPAEDAQTQLIFIHQGMGPGKESHTATVEGWQRYLAQSLRAYVEDGVGRPYRGGP
jgi:uncharacterized protein YndB with AHSA1/START domain